jgi:ABC-2 type transport system permease protein
MTSSLSRDLHAPLAVEASRPGAAQVVRVELGKLAGQLPIRVVAAVVVLAPFAVAAVLKAQGAVPADTLFGRWVHTSGFALPLVVLGFAGSWGFPVLAGLVAGDVFAGEDRHDTWKLLLTRSCGRGEIFVGKTLAAAACAVVMVAALALSSVAAGALILGTRPLVGLSGTLLAPGQALWLTLLSWLIALLPMLGFVSLALLISVATRSSVMGVLGPVIVGVAMQLLSLVGKGEVVRTLLLTSGFDSWHGLFTAPRFYGPLERSAAVSVAYIVVSLMIAWVVLKRRDFAGSDAGGRSGWVAPARALLVAGAAVALLAAASGWGPTSVTASRLESSISTTFSNLAVYQQTLLGHSLPAGAGLDVLPTCKRRGVSTPLRGQGDDWHCTLDVVGRQAQQMPLGFDVNVRANGCYTAEGPPSVIGPATIRSRGRGVVPNPLFVFDGCFDTS